MKELIQTLKANTANNLHTENYILLCKHFNLAALAAICTAINTIQQVENCLPAGIVGYRYEIYERMLAEVRKLTTTEDYLLIHMSL